MGLPRKAAAQACAPVMLLWIFALIWCERTCPTIKCTCLRMASPAPVQLTSIVVFSCHTPLSAAPSSKFVLLTDARLLTLGHTVMFKLTHISVYAHFCATSHPWVCSCSLLHVLLTDAQLLTHGHAPARFCMSPSQMRGFSPMGMLLFSLLHVLLTLAQSLTLGHAVQRHAGARGEGRPSAPGGIFPAH
jgi:hypothetical protein